MRGVRATNPPSPYFFNKKVAVGLSIEVIVLTALYQNLLFLLSGLLFILGLWQLDHLIAPYIWELKGKLWEVTPWHRFEITKFYVLCFLCIVLAYFIMVLAAII